LGVSLRSGTKRGKIGFQFYCGTQQEEITLEGREVEDLAEVVVGCGV
jgi:hypothetical protein